MIHTYMWISADTNMTIVGLEAIKSTYGSKQIPIMS